MASSSSAKKVPSPERLVSKVLHPGASTGESIKIGRKSSCELIVKCPFISGVHCKVDVTGSSNSTGESLSSFDDGLRFFVTDLSSNGTWVLKDASRSTLCTDSADVQLEKGHYKHAKKLTKVKEEILPGDCILLLAPAHKECEQYCFTVKRKGSEYILEQLPKAFHQNKETLGDFKESTGPPALPSSSSSVRSLVDAESVKHCGSESESGSATDGGKHSTSSTSDDTTKTSMKDCDPSSSKSSKSPSLNRSSESLAPRASLESSSTDPDGEEIEMERCPNCWKLFPVHELPLHSPICQDSASRRNNLTSVSRSRETADSAGVVVISSNMSRKRPATHIATIDDCMEQCPHCLDLFPLELLISHAETCSMASSSAGSSSSSSSSSGGSESTKSRSSGRESVDSAIAPIPVSVSRDLSMEQCPYCSELMPVAELIGHCVTCTCTASSLTSAPAGTTASTFCSATGDLSDVETDSVVIKRARYTLEPYERGAVGTSSSSFGDAGSGLGSTSEMDARGKGMGSTDTDGADDLEQCVHCLNEFPISELVSHAASCSAAAKGAGVENSVLEHCQHCLNVFPLSDLVAHALNCSQRRDVGSLDTDDGAVGDEEMWGEPLERCMHCFKDFPLSKIVGHSGKCRGDMLGSRERFKNFLPSVHDLDPMSLAVLNEAQMRAVEYVMEISKKESESLYTQLKDRVVGLGYTEHDLERTLQWIRRDAPIIIHLKLDRVLRFLVNDTHYRNLFETHTGSGSLDKSARSSWENRIFNNFYQRSAPVDRVKYGVLNIVGDPRGVSCCSGYGDSFLQLKKVRLRTTFASEDTSSSRVVLSCCEHYGNVLYRYNNSELKAILEVATRKVEFLRSDMISQYKEIQIHGPVCLSENVDCIVVNERHSADTAMRDLLDEFVTKNKCNLIWMERADRIDYPSFTPVPAHIPTFFPPPPLPPAPPVVPPVFPPISAPPPRPRTRRRKRGRRSRTSDWY